MTRAILVLLILVALCQYVGRDKEEYAPIPPAAAHTHLCAKFQCF